MKRNKMMRVASTLLVAVMLTTCVISGTYAKYTSKATGSDAARVAKWSIEVEGTQIAVAGDTTVAFDLFDTINDTGNTTAETDVKSGKIVAPGTAGSFQIDIANKSEVNAEYTIELSETNEKEIPLQYSVDGTTWKDSIGELVMDDLTNVKIAMETGTDNVTVYWRWAFEGANGHSGQTDVTDTALGYEAFTSTTDIKVEITATITVTQVD